MPRSLMVSLLQMLYRFFSSLPLALGSNSRMKSADDTFWMAAVQSAGVLPATSPTNGSDRPVHSDLPLAPCISFMTEFLTSSSCLAYRTAQRPTAGIDSILPCASLSNMLLAVRSCSLPPPNTILPALSCAPEYLTGSLWILMPYSSMSFWQSALLLIRSTSCPHLLSLSPGEGLISFPSSIISRKSALMSSLMPVCMHSSGTSAMDSLAPPRPLSRLLMSIGWFTSATSRLCAVFYYSLNEMVFLVPPILASKVDSGVMEKSTSWIC